jgi:phage terminase Nu1 subunit (DNA packaging protein)
MGDEMKTAETVGAGELADWLGVTSQTISAFANDNKVVRVSRGKYNLRASVRTYTAHLREVAAQRGGEAGVLDLVQERARLAREQADGQELKNRQLRKELLSAADVEREWSDILRKVRAGILAVTSRVRASAGLTAEQAVEMDAELRLALKELGNDQEYPPGGAESADTAHAATAFGVD